MPVVPQFLLSRRQAAQSLSISLRTLDYLIAGGTSPSAALDGVR